MGSDARVERPSRPTRAAGRRRLHWLLYTILILIGAAAVFSISVLSCIPVKIPESGSRQGVVFYAAPFPLVEGVRVEPRELEERLRRLDYRESPEPAAPGEFASRRSRFEIHLRPFDFPGRDAAGGRVRVYLEDGAIAEVEPLDPMNDGDLRLEPERIAGYEGGQGAVLKPLKLAEAPPLLVQAILASEDRRFYQHPGIDLVGTVRAVLRNVREREVAQGGSTITQQLARSLFLQNKKTLLRKATEAVLAVGLEIRYSKEEILQAYLNAVYLGTWGPMEIRGVREASLYYLGEDIQEADLAGIALLVALIPAPNVFSPYQHPDLARERRNVVLQMLARRGVISEAEAKRAAAQKLPSTRPPARASEASYFLDAARVEVERRAPKGTLNRRGVKIFTTLDPRDQAAAVSAVERGLADLEKSHRKLRRKDATLQAAAVSIDPRTGEVRALVGGRNFLRHPYNRAVEARRQPGSLFKPFVYLAAFQERSRGKGNYWTPATLLADEEYAVRAGRRTWRPRNYDGEFRGPVTMRQALEQSLNVPTVRVAMEVGIPAVAAAARDCGIVSELREVPSLALGTSEVSLLEITGAYATFADRGEAHAPHLLLGILDADGREIRLDALEDPPGIRRDAAYMVTSLMEGVIRSGTGSRARALGVRGAAAGKTGTTDGYHDAWFVGFTPRRALGVWVGFDRNEAIGLSGAAAALPIWARAMRDAAGRHGDGPFDRPRGVERVLICSESGLLAGVECPAVTDEDFLRGTAPEELCDLHRKSIITRFWDWLGP